MSVYSSRKRTPMIVYVLVAIVALLAFALGHAERRVGVVSTMLSTAMQNCPASVSPAPDLRGSK